MKKQWKRIKDVFSSICLVDRILMLFMTVLLVSMAFYLYEAPAMFEEGGSIDTIVRTSASAIFGYFISGNFLKTDSSPKDEEKPAETAPASPVCYGRIQVIVVSTIGMISLILLLMVGNFAEVTPEFAATVSQLRDFVAACVGFLVSCEKKR